MKLKYLYGFNEFQPSEWKVMENDLTDAFSPSDEFSGDVGIENLVDHSNLVDPTDVGGEDETKKYLKKVVQSAKKKINGKGRRDEIFQDEDNS